MTVVDNLDLAALSADELTALRARIDDRLTRLAAQERAKARRRIVELASEHQIDLAELAASPQFRDPKNQFNTWTGKGRKPAWVRARLAEGLSLDALRNA